MNIETTNSKDNYSPDAVKNRLISIEKTLQQIIQLFGISSLHSEIIDKNNRFVEKFSLTSMKAEQIADLNRTVINPAQALLNQEKASKNNLLLSHGQIISELAMAIVRANGRNS